ncbi:tetratricopeptide repeat protein [uncultured Muriicola sp.]|uniref:tetratricopeptide repeat protein n=1 Tax=uncultured Muriicola sp. TaxID=1583102 RepID=UPI00261B88A7|nr:tetratricopeptide repeat protein [uncultured Muriicola sp.]
MKLNHRLTSIVLILIGAVVGLICLSCGVPKTNQMGDSGDEHLYGEGIEDVPEEIANEILSIERRGKELYQNECAAWIATDMLFASNPDKSKLGVWFTEKEGDRWYVYFGQYIEEVKKFKAGYVYVCTERCNCQRADVNHQTENTNQFAAAVVNARRILKKHIPYNVNVLRELDSTITVYLTPGNADPNVVLLGGDYKITLSADGSQVLNIKKLHHTILKTPSQIDGKKGRSVGHLHVTSDLPSATDVAFILLNPHLAPHLVWTEFWTTRIDANGKVVVVDRPAWVMRIEGRYFIDNLPDQWEGWLPLADGGSAKYKLKIAKIDGNKVQLTGFRGTDTLGNGYDEVYGHVENSTLFLTWPIAGGGQCKDELRITKLSDDPARLVVQTQCKGWEARFHLKKIDKAISDYNKAIEINPRNGTAYFHRGLAYYDKGQYDDAISDYSKAIEINPKYGEAYNNRGLAYREKGQFDKAISDYNKAIELKYVESYINRGLLYYSKEEYDKAISDYSKAIELINPKSAVDYRMRGYAYYLKGWIDEAISDYNKAMELDPKNATNYHYRGLAYRSLAQYDKAISDYDKAIELDPKNAETYRRRKEAYNRKKFQESLK